MKIASMSSLIILLFGGCSPRVTVDQIDRVYLSDYMMKTDRDSLSFKMFDHAYYSREGSRGGKGIGGGGCGCN